MTENKLTPAEYSIDDVIIINHKEKSDVDRIKQQIISNQQELATLKSKIERKESEIKGLNELVAIFGKCTSCGSNDIWYRYDDDLPDSEQWACNKCGMNT